MLQGEPVTYEKLASVAGCTVRTVRNYLAHAEDVLGFPIEKSRDEKRRTLVRAVGVSPRKNTTKAVPSKVAVQHEPHKSQKAQCVKTAGSDVGKQSGTSKKSVQNARVKHGSEQGATCCEKLCSGAGSGHGGFASALLACFFGEQTGEASDSSSIVVATHGLACYNPVLHDISVQFADACRARDFAVQLAMADGSDDVVLWPLAVVLHNVFGVLLVGLPYESQVLSDVLTVPLSRVLPDISRVKQVQGKRCKALDDANVHELLDLPFTAWTARADVAMTRVHVRFDAKISQHLMSVQWHRQQQVVLRTDGKLDVRFGPVPLDQAASWLASFGTAVRVMGGKKLRKTLKKGNFSPVWPLR